MKKSAIVLFTLLICTQAGFSVTLPQIPASTLQAAREAAISQNSPSSEVVRVGIGTQNFGTYQYKEITVFGTGDTQIYDNRLLTHQIRKLKFR